MFAWAGGALFAASLTYFAFSYALRFGVPAEGSPAAVVWNVLLFTLFALHHSLFARQMIRRRLRAHLSPRNERALYVWVASLLFFLVCAAWQPVGGQVGGWPDLAWLHGGLLLTGVWLTARSAAIVGVLELAGIRETRRAEFTTSGPYGLIRHPIYLGWFLIVFGVPNMTWTQLLFASVSGLYVVAAIPWEERSLLATAGNDYARYQQKVPWRLVPGLY